MSFFAMSGGARSPIAIVGTVSGNVNTTNNTTHALGNIDVGPSSTDKNIILGFSFSNNNPRTISSATVGGVSLTERVVIALVAGEDIAAAIWNGDISSINGSQAISVTFSSGTQSSGVSGVAVSGLSSLVPASTATDSSTGADTTLSSLSSPGGGFTFACGAGALFNAGFTWTNLTERVDVDTGTDSQDHRHSAAWDLGGRVAQDVTIATSGSSDMAVVGAGFR